MLQLRSDHRGLWLRPIHPERRGLSVAGHGGRNRVHDVANAGHGRPGGRPGTWPGHYPARPRGLAGTVDDRDPRARVVRRVSMVLGASSLRLHRARHARVATIAPAPAPPQRERGQDDVESVERLDLVRVLVTAHQVPLQLR